MEPAWRRAERAPKVEVEPEVKEEFKPRELTEPKPFSFMVNTEEAIKEAKRQKEAVAAAAEAKKEVQEEARQRKKEADAEKLRQKKEAAAEASMEMAPVSAADMRPASKNPASQKVKKPTPKPTPRPTPRASKATLPPDEIKRVREIYKDCCDVGGTKVAVGQLAALVKAVLKGYLAADATKRLVGLAEEALPAKCPSGMLKEDDFKAWYAEHAWPEVKVGMEGKASEAKAAAAEKQAAQAAKEKAAAKAAEKAKKSPAMVAHEKKAEKVAAAEKVADGERRQTNAKKPGGKAATTEDVSPVSVTVAEVETKLAALKSRTDLDPTELNKQIYALENDESYVAAKQEQVASFTGSHPAPTGDPDKDRITKVKSGAKPLVLSAVTEVGRLLELASAKLRGDRDVALAAVTQDGSALEFASEAMRGDRGVVLAAVEHSGTEWGTDSALRFATRQPRGDLGVALAAVHNDGSALEFCSARLQNYPELVLAAVQKDGWALAHASEELRADRAIVLAAVQENGGALESASEELKGDREIVMAAVTTNPWALIHASKELRRDRDIEVAAAQVGGSLECESEERLREERDAVLRSRPTSLETLAPAFDNALAAVQAIGTYRDGVEYQEAEVPERRDLDGIRGEGGEEGHPVDRGPPDLRHLSYSSGELGIPFFRTAAEGLPPPDPEDEQY